MAVDVLLGPGNHLVELLQALEEANLLQRAVHTWPRFFVEEHDQATQRRETVFGFPWFSRFEWLIWALWRRLPFIGRSDFPRAFIFDLADRLASRQLQSCDLFVGWAQISLHCLERSNRRAAITVLEHPMVHLDTWIQLVEEEYQRWGDTKSAYSRFSKPLQRRMRKEYETADYICVLSDFARQSFLRAGIPAKRILQMSLGVDTDVFKPAHRTDAVFRVLFVGRLELLKGIQYLLPAFKEASLPNAELCLVGPVLPEAEDLLAQYSSPSIKVAGAVARKDLVAIYQQADVFVFPTVNDAFGLVLIEAMACGIPVIATLHCVAPEAIDDGMEGYLVSVRDSAMIRERLRTLHAQPDLRRRMADAARARAVRQFDSAAYRLQVARTYTHLIQQRRGSPTRC